MMGNEVTSREEQAKQLGFWLLDVINGKPALLEAVEHSLGT